MAQMGPWGQPTPANHRLLPAMTQPCCLVPRCPAAYYHYEEGYSVLYLLFFQGYDTHNRRSAVWTATYSACQLAALGGTPATAYLWPAPYVSSRFP